jgi:hypothetical protein
VRLEGQVSWGRLIVSLLAIAALIAAVVLLDKS